MKAEIIKETINTTYKDENGNIINEITPQHKLMISLYQPHLCTIENNIEVVEVLKAKTKKEMEIIYHNYMNINKLNIENYYLKYY